MISVRNLTLQYGDKPVLHDVTFEVERGSFCAVMGANGCGKSSLLRCLAHLQEPQQGLIALNGRPVQDFSIRELAQQIAFVHQRPQADFEFTAFETVLMGRNPYQRRLQNESQQDWDIVEEAMHRTHTWHLRFARPDEMSGGEFQRVMLARALAQQSPILLLDEPLANLDIAHQFDIMELLSGLRDKTILLVIHDLNMAQRYCRQLLLFAQGSMLFHGPLSEGLTPSLIEQAFHVSGHQEHPDEPFLLSPLRSQE